MDQHMDFSFTALLSVCDTSSELHTYCQLYKVDSMK